MLRALKFLLVAAIFLAVAWWIGTLPGQVVAHSGPYVVQVSVPGAVLILFVLALILTVVLRVLGGLRRAPGSLGAWRGGRKLAQADLATQRGMVALAAGDAKAATAQAARARKLSGDGPLALWLSAEAARLAGDANRAKAAFMVLAAHKEMGFIGHRGLLRHSFAEGAHEDAQGHAQAAEDAYPGSHWLADKRLALAVRQKHYASALKLARTPAQIAALATGAARQAVDKTAARKFAKQAVRADPGLAPAVVEYARLLADAGKTRGARAVLLAGWKARPHMMIAEAFLAPDATPLARAQAAGVLAAQAPGHVESEYLLAATSFAAGLTGEARSHAQAALNEGGTDGRAAAILAKLDGKPAPVGGAAPGWVCDVCHISEPVWSPACAHCHAPGSLVWG
ncbi:MAG: heme biosynthesis HemY N-terminal domain-containing protein [Acidocella sp.]|nr:heme biosynthesis HemY N-terminal domain-containing protein [Acidocella sp.]